MVLPANNPKFLKKPRSFRTEVFFFAESLLGNSSENCFEVVPDLLDGRDVAALVG